MTQPLALVVYEKLLPGTQVVNRLQDLNYRVQTVADAQTLLACAQAETPMVIVADLSSTHQDVCACIAHLHQNHGTLHIPIIAFAPEGSDLQAAALSAGAVLAISESAVLSHLSELLEQALRVE